MKFSTLTALIGTSAAGLGHKAEPSRLQKLFKNRMDEVKLMELDAAPTFDTADKPFSTVSY
jgi:hypothetical protein